MYDCMGVCVVCSVDVCYSARDVVCLFDVCVFIRRRRMC